MQWPMGGAANRGQRHRRSRRQAATWARVYRPRIRRLEERRVLDVSAAFTAATGQLEVVLAGSPDTATLSVSQGTIVITDGQNQSVAIDVDGGGPGTVSASDVDAIAVRGDAAPDQTFVLAVPLALPKGLSIDSFVERAELRGDISLVSEGAVISDAGVTQLEGNIHVTGHSISFGGDVELLGDARLTAVDVAFAGRVDDDGVAQTSSVLEIHSTGLTRLAGDVGAAQALTRLETDAAGRTELGGSVHASGSTVVFADPVTLTTDVFISDGGTTGILFGSTVDSAADSHFRLRLEAPQGRIEFRGNVGAGGGGDQRLGELTVEQAGTGVLFGGATGITSIRVRGDVDLGVGVNVIGGAGVVWNADTASLQIETSGGSLRVNGPAVLASDVSIDSGGGDVTFTADAPLDSAPNRTQSLTIHAGAGAVFFHEDIGGQAALRGLTVARADGGVTFGGAGIETPGGTGPVEVVRSVDAIRIGSAATAIAGGIVLRGGPTGLVVTTTGDDVVWNGPVTLASDVLIDTGAGPGDIRFSTGRVDSAAGSASDLVLDAGAGAAWFSHDLGGLQALGDLRVVRAAGGVTLGTADATNVASGDGPVQTVVADRIEFGEGGNTIGGVGIVLNGGVLGTLTLTTLADDIRLNGAVTLASDVAMVVARNLTMTSDAPVDSEAGEVHSLTLDAPAGAIRLNEDLGSTTPLGALTVIRAAEGLVLGGATSETPGSGGSGPVEVVRLEGALLVGAGPDEIGGVGIVVSGSATSRQEISTTGDDLRWHGPLWLHTDLALVTGGGDITFTNAASIDSAPGRVGGLILDAGGGEIRFNEDLGSVRRLGALTIVQAGGVWFGEAAMESGGADLKGPVHAIHADQPVDLGVGGSVLGRIVVHGGAAGTTLTSTGDNIRFNGPVLLDSDLRLETGAGPGDVTFTSAATMDSRDGPGSPPGQRSDLVIDAGLGGVFFNASLGTTQPLGQLRVLRAAKGVEFGSADLPTPGGSGPVALIRTDGPVDIGAGPASENIPGSVVLNGGVAPLVIETSGDNVRVNGPTLLHSAVRVRTGPGNGSLLFTAAATLDGAPGELNALDLLLDAGSVDFVAAVGSVQRLGTLTIQSAQDVRFHEGVTASRLVQAAGSGTLAAAGHVNTDHTALPGIDITGNAVRFQGPVTATGDGRVVIRHTGLLDLDPDADLRLDGTFSESGGGAVDLAGSIATSGDAILFAGPVRLTDGAAGGVLLSTVAGGNSAGALIQFAQALNGQTGGAENLLLNAGSSGDILFQGAVGDAVRLGSLTIVASRDITWQGPLRAARVSQLQGTGTTTFGGAVDLNHATFESIAVITVEVRFQGPVTTAGEGSVDVTVSGRLDLAAGADLSLQGAFRQRGAGGVSTSADITTAGREISFASSVTLIDDVQLDTGSGPGGISFHSTLDGAIPLQQDLRLQAGLGDVSFAAAVGNQIPLGALRIDRAGNVLFAAPVHAAAVTQAAGSGETRVAGTMSALAPGGTLSLHNFRLTVDAPLLALDNALDLIADDDLVVNASLTTNHSPAVLSAGNDVRLTTPGSITAGQGDVTVVGDRDQVGGGGIFLADGAVVAAPAGAVRFTAHDDITLGRILAGHLVALHSTAGGVVDGGDTGGADVDAPAFSFQTGAGVGQFNGIETSVSHIAGVNFGAGGIRIANDRPGTLTLGEVENLAGLVDEGDGQVEVVHRGPIDVTRRLSNRGGGDTLLRAELPGDLTVDAPIQNTGGHGFIHLFAGGDLVIHNSLPEPRDAAGRQIEHPADPTQFFEIMVAGEGGIRGEAVGKVLIDNGEQDFVIVRTETGQITNAPPLVTIETLDQGGSDVDSFGRAFVQVTLGDKVHLETNYHIMIDWGDGEVESFPIPGTINPARLPDFRANTDPRFDSGNGEEGVYVFLHKYFSNPNADNPSTSIPIRVDVRYDARSSGDTSVDANRPATGSPVFNGIRFFENVAEEVFTTRTGEFTVPGSGVFGFVKVVESVIVPVESRPVTTEVVVTPPVTFAASTAVSDEFATTQFEIEVTAEYRVFMRVVDDVANTEGPDIPLDESVLDDPVSIFRNRRFPNGHYRIYLEEVRTRRVRMILDVHIYNGRVVPPNFRDTAGEKRTEEADAVPPATLPPLGVREDPHPAASDGAAAAVSFRTAPSAVPVHPPGGSPPVLDSPPVPARSPAETSVAPVVGVALGGTAVPRAAVRAALAAGIPPLSRAARRLRQVLHQQPRAPGPGGRP